MAQTIEVSQAELQTLNLEVERQFPGLPDPVGERRPYIAELKTGAPWWCLHVRGVPFTNLRQTPGERDRPPMHLPNVIHLADNQRDALIELCRATRKAMRVSYTSSNGEKLTTMAKVPVSRWTQLRPYVEQVTAPISMEAPIAPEPIVEREEAPARRGPGRPRKIEAPAPEAFAAQE